MDKILSKDMANDNEAVHVKKMNTLLFFVVVFLIQLIFIFQGVDICDGGSYANFYQQFFNNPGSVEYSFMFWLSGLIGGLYLKLLPGLGILGLRLLGVMTITTTAYFTYRLLKNYVNEGILQLSLIILILFINNNPKEFYYNNLSAFIYIQAACFLFTGLRSNKRTLIFFGGLWVALNVFNRTPNFLGIGMASSIFYYGWMQKASIKKQFSQCFFFISGFVVCAGLTLAVMHWMGHLNLYINSLKMVFSMGKSSRQTDGTESSYGILNLLNLLYTQYKFSLYAAITFFVFVLFAIPAIQHIKLRFPYSIVRFMLSKYILVLTILLLIIIRKIDYIGIIYFMTGLCITTAAVLFISNRNKEINLLLFLGVFIALIHPLGSSTGIHTVIIYSLWIVFPIVLEYLFTINQTELNLTFNGKHTDFSSRFRLTNTQLYTIRKTGAALLLFACLYSSFFYPYFDRYNRFDMHYGIQSKYMKGIFTTKKRADVLNELLKESEKYVKPNDYVLAYDCMPLYHYLTNTKPYLGNPWPWLYQPDVFNNELVRSADQIKKRPVVIFQMIRTMGPNGGKWPDYSSGETTMNWVINKSRNEILSEFLKTNEYKEVWSNKAFAILVPGENVHL